MTYLLFLILTAATQVAVILTDRGAREARRWGTPQGQARAFNLIERCQSAGAEVAHLSVIDLVNLQQGGKSASRGRTIYRSLFADLSIITMGWLVSLVPFIPSWIPAVLVAVHSALSPTFGLFLFRFRGEIPGSDPRTGQSALIEWPPRIVFVAMAAFAYWLIFMQPQSLIGVRVQNGWLWATLLAIAAYVLLLSGNSLERLGRRLAVLRYKVTFAQDTTDRTVLYLRSFAEDRVSLWYPFTDATLRSVLFPRTSFEQFLSLASITEGDVVTVGDPNEKIPLTGGYRVYFRHSLSEREQEWKQAVHQTAALARGVVLTAGTTPALAWEIGHLREWGLLGKCVFFFPPDSPAGTARRRAALLDAIRPSADQRRLAESVPVELLAALTMTSDGRLISFTTTGRDYHNYMLALSAFWSSLSSEATDMTRADIGDADDDGHNTLEGRPRYIPSGLRTVVRHSMGFYRAYQADQEARALQLCKQMVREMPQDALPEAQCYLAYWHGLLLGANGQLSEASAELDRAMRSMGDAKWLWTDPTEGPLTPDEFAFTCCEGIMESLWPAEIPELRVVRRATAREMARLGDQMNDRRKTAKGLTTLGREFWRSDEAAAAVEPLQRASAIYQRLGDPAREADTHYWLSQALRDLGDPAFMQEIDKVIDLGEKSAQPWMVAMALRDAADVALEAGDNSQAVALLTRGLKVVPADDEDTAQELTQRLDATRAVERARGMLAGSALQAWKLTEQYAQRVGVISAAHLLQAVVEVGDPMALEMLTNRGLAPARIETFLRARMDSYPDSPVHGPLPLTDQTRNVLCSAVATADERGSSRITAADLMTALLAVDHGDVVDALNPAKWDQDSEIASAKVSADKRSITELATPDAEAQAEYTTSDYSNSREANPRGPSSNTFSNAIGPHTSAQSQVSTSDEPNTDQSPDTSLWFVVLASIATLVVFCIVLASSILFTASGEFTEGTVLRMNLMVTYGVVALLTLLVIMVPIDESGLAFRVLPALVVAAFLMVSVVLFVRGSVSVTVLPHGVIGGRRILTCLIIGFVLALVQSVVRLFSSKTHPVANAIVIAALWLIGKLSGIGLGFDPWWSFLVLAAAQAAILRAIDSALGLPGYLFVLPGQTMSGRAAQRQFQILNALTDQEDDH